jgi:hypothetical protein
LAVLLIGLTACGNDPKVIVFDASGDNLRCNPLTQSGCEAGEKCANRILQGGVNPIIEITCVPDGTVAIDGACTYGAFGESGYSNCKAGGECIGTRNGVCKQICDHQTKGSCDANHACGTYASFFESNNKTVAGVCETKCDPLKQELVLGTRTAACGAADPAMADNGCFTANLEDFTCARIPSDPMNAQNDALSRTDRVPALAPPTGGAYVNGCAAGYIPFFVEREGSMTVTCTGLCAPAKTDNTAQNAVNAQGDVNAIAKLHNKAMPAAGDGVCTVDKKGSAEPENCHYLWFWHFDRDGVLIPGPYNDTLGVCWAYGKYSTTIGGVMHGWPKCESLPPKGATKDPIYGDAADWPCVPSGQANPLALRKARTAARDYHFGARPGPGVRHILVQD